MALKTVIPFPIFAPNFTTTTTTVTTTATTTELRFSRWNNANADKFNQQRRSQQQIEDDLRRFRRFETALNIAHIYNNSTTPSTQPNPKSSGTPSSPSLSSIPGKKSKYSKNPKPNFTQTVKRTSFSGDETETFRNVVRGTDKYAKTQKNPNPNFAKPQKNPNPNSATHPAFRRTLKTRKLPVEGETARETAVKVGEEGLSYVVPGAPFEFMYSYTESPKVKPIGLREPAIAPFGPETVPRPWTGRKPLPPSKKKLPEFDSFLLPPANKKGVKPVQKPGPFLPGSGPRYVMSREEVLGEPLTGDEVKELIEGCKKTKRQLNMGRDGLTHNMLDNIHSHWKRKRVCKIKCKGVCTVDMDNVCQQLEEKTGGKIIYRRGGVLYLFRGRNYNYRTRPRFPLMLWKPVTPVYPRLVQRVPEGLTLEQATDMRNRGRELPPICKLGKNGVYANLVKEVREAFEACELVRINCQGLNPSDYRRIGAKLKDLVPCVLISFEYEHILMWRGTDWKSSLVLLEDGSMGAKSSEADSAAIPSSCNTYPLASVDTEKLSSCSSSSTIQETSVGMLNLSTNLTDDSEVDVREDEGIFYGKDEISVEVNDLIPPQAATLESQSMLNSDNSSSDDFIAAADTCEKENGIVNNFSDEKEPSSLMQSASVLDVDHIDDMKAPLGNASADSASQRALQDMTESSEESSLPPLTSPCTEGVLFLLRQALENGSAVVLDDNYLDADVVYQKSVAFAEVAPPGPVFRHRPRKVAVQNCEKKESVDLEVDTVVPVAEKKSNEKKSKERKSSRINKIQDIKEDYLNVVPQGSLKVDELAKLLA